MAFFTEIGILFTGMTVPALIALILGFVFFNPVSAYSASSAAY